MPNGFEGFQAKSTEIEELSEKELKYGYWFITHKAQLLRLFIIFLITFSVCTFGYTAYRLLSLYYFQYDEFQAALTTASVDYVNVQGIHQLNAIQPLQIVSRDVLSASDGKIDMAVRVKNPNTKWALKSFQYQFSLGGKFFDKKQGFLLPGEEKYLMLLNVAGFASGTPQVLFSDEQWHRVTQYDTWGPERLNFLITNKKFIPARQGEISGKIPVSEVTADITNATAFNYNAVQMQFILFSGSRVVGFSQLSVPDFLSGTKRPLASRWTTSLAPVTNVEIIPTVNIIDEKVYQQFEGQFDPSIKEIEQRRF